MTEFEKKFEVKNVELIKTKKKIRKNLISRMKEDGSKLGPMSILHRCLDQKLKAKVWTRNSYCVRGICTGYIVAYDKHCNLAMIEVEEIYLNPVTEKAFNKRKQARQEIVEGGKKKLERISYETEAISNSVPNTLLRPTGNVTGTKNRPNSDRFFAEEAGSSSSSSMQKNRPYSSKFIEETECDQKYESIDPDIKNRKFITPPYEDGDDDDVNDKINTLDLNDAKNTRNTKDTINTTTNINDTKKNTRNINDKINTKNIEDAVNILNKNNTINTLNIKDTMNTLDIKDTIDTLNINNTIKTLNIKDTINALDIKDTIDTLNINNTINTLNIKDPIKILNKNDTINTLNINDTINTLNINNTINTTNINDTINTLNKNDTINTLNKNDTINTLNKNDTINTLNRNDSINTLNINNSINTLNINDTINTTNINDRKMPNPELKNKDNKSVISFTDDEKLKSTKINKNIPSLSIEITGDNIIKRRSSKSGCEQWQEYLIRNVGQLFIRGDNVVMIGIVN